MDDAQNAKVRCPGSGEQYKRLLFDGGFWRPCSICGQRFLPLVGGFMPEHRTLRGGDVTTVHLVGGPWDGQQIEVECVVGPVLAVGHKVGNHYWLDTKSDPPAYHWDGAQSDGTSEGEVSG